MYVYMYMYMYMYIYMYMYVYIYTYVYICFILHVDIHINHYTAFHTLWQAKLWSRGAKIVFRASQIAKKLSVDPYTIRILDIRVDPCRLNPIKSFVSVCSAFQKHTNQSAVACLSTHCLVLNETFLYQNEKKEPEKEKKTYPDTAWFSHQHPN